MKIESTIRVGNNVTLKTDRVKITTPCCGFVSIYIPLNGSVLEVELDRMELTEFLLRTQPNYQATWAVDSRQITP